MQQLSHRRDVFSIDVSPYPMHHRKATAYALAVVNQGKLINSATTLTPSSAAAQATAIALAIRMANQQGISAYVVSAPRQLGACTSEVFCQQGPFRYWEANSHLITG